MVTESCFLHPGNGKLPKATVIKAKWCDVGCC